MRFVKILLILVLSFGVSANLLFPQAGRGQGRLSGEVKDEQGNPIDAAKVTLQPLEFKTAALETKTNKKGKWAFMGLGSGNWKVIVSAEGYATAEQVVFVSQLDRNPTVVMSLKKATPEKVVEYEEFVELIDQGNKYYEARQYDEAIASFRQFLEKKPEAFQVHFNIGNCFKEKGDYDQALEEYRLVLARLEEKSPELKGKDSELAAKVLAAMGEIYIRMENFDLAQESFKKSLTLNPADEALAYMVGEIYFSNGKVDEAIGYYKLASQIKPDWALSYLKIGYSYLNKQDYEKAKENLNKYLELAPDAPNSEEIKKLIQSLKD